MKKGLYIKDIRPGSDVTGLFCVSSESMRQTRNGAPFISLTVSDNTGSMEARIWDRARELDILFEKGDIVELQAEAVEFNGQCQPKVNHLRQIEREEEINPAMFLPSAPIDRNEYWNLCRKAIRSVKNRELKRVLEELFSPNNIKDAFCQAPAAKKMHHAYIGGLLEHSVNLLKLSGLVCKLYPHLDRDLMVAVSLCHDIGKTRELSWKKPPIDYTDQGRLLGHIAMGLQMVEGAIDAARLRGGSGSMLALKHIILSHHGQREFGSPVLPMTEEAVVFHMIDDLDAKLNFLNNLKKEGPEPGWTDFQRLFERYFFLAPKSLEHAGDAVSDHGGAGTDSPGKEPGSKPAQAQLWDTFRKLDRKD